MPDDLATIASYTTAYEAHIAKACLEEAGIHVFLQDVETVGLQWELSNVIGGVKLQVPADDAQRATDILNQNKPQQFPSMPNPYAPQEPETCQCLSCGYNMPDDVDTCPKCGWTFHETQ